METRVANISIIVEKFDKIEELNSILHEYGDYIIGRMGIPYRKKNGWMSSLICDNPSHTAAMTKRANT